jgi:hypothetical protein
MQTATAGTTPTIDPATGTTPSIDPAAVLNAELDRTAALRWQAILEYRDRMAALGQAVLFAPYGGEVDWHLRLAGIAIGAELVILGRRDEAGRQRWDALPGADTAARAGDCVLHGAGGDADPVDLWNVCGRFRRVATASHPNTPAELIHVLEQLDGSLG